MSRVAIENDPKNSGIEKPMEKRDRRFIPSSRVARSQIFHFVIVTVMPTLLCFVWFIFYPSFTLTNLVLLSGMWTLTGGLGVSLGYHRYFTHGAFAAHPILESAMAMAGSMAGQGPITYWVTIHRCHHQFSDEVFDPHSPQPPPGRSSIWSRLLAFMHGHVAWVLRHDVPSPIYFARDLLKNHRVQWFDRTYWYWLFLGVILPGLFLFSFTLSFEAFCEGCVFGGLLRILIGNQIIWAINSVCHATGSHDFETRDFSKNNPFLAVPAFGEGWHNNHHAFPWSARFGLKWWQLDLGWCGLKVFYWLGLARNLKQPKADQIKETLGN